MDMNRLRALRELARCGTMAAAAEALFLTPSAVSQQIAQLEEEAGISRTERRGRGVRLTPAGEALVAHTERILMVLAEANSELAQLRREIAGELRVAAFPSIASAVMPETLKALRAVFPRLQIVLEEMEPLEGLGALGSWRTDLAVIDDLSVLLARKHETYGLIPLTEDTLHVLLPSGHPFATRQSLTVADLRDQDWARDSTSSAFSDFVANRCRRSGYEPRRNARGKGFEMVAAMVTSGGSVSIVPGLRLVKPLKGAKAIRLRPEVRRKISIAYRNGERNHPAVSVFVEELVRVTGKLLAAPSQ
jgi:DNA-binding transcriptional LysR family regulator